MSNKVVVTGATGNIGSKVVSQLCADGSKEVVACVRNLEKAAPLQAAGASLAQADLYDAATLRAAFEGADTLVLITESCWEQVVHTSNALVAAREMGVRKIVRVSAVKCDEKTISDSLRQHDHAEQMIRDLGFDYVILRPTAFMDSLLWFMEGVIAEGNLYFGTGDGRIGVIDTRDIADCLVAATLTDKFDNQTFELSGAASVSYHDIAATVGEALGKDVTFVPLPPEAVAQGLRDAGFDDWLAQATQDYCTLYTENFSDFATDSVEQITGHPARSVQDFVRDIFVPAVAAAQA